ncbi:MAG: bifunctional DNA primase/polymerase, partial [Phycisphaerae bacterium]
AGVKWRRYQAKQPSSKTVTRWMRLADLTGIGVVHRDGLCCRDFDTPESYRAWAEEWANLAAHLPTVRTVRGARVYFENHEFGYLKFADGELIAGQRHYSVMPPSRHPTGALYRWSVPLGPELYVIDDLELAGLVPTSVTYQAHQAHQAHQAQSDPVSPSQWEWVGGGADLPDAAVLPEPSPEHVEIVMHHTLPRGPGERHRRVFDLMIALRVLGYRTPLECKAQVRVWFERALPVITSKAFAHTWEDFLIAWKNFDPAKVGLKSALLRARLRGRPPELVAEEDEDLVTVAALCRELQRAAGEHNFFLSTHEAGTLMGVPPMTVWRKLIVLQGEEMLVCETVGSFENHRASEYHWLGIR